jgi:hypothetical protein
MYIYQYLYIYAAVSNGKLKKNRSPPSNFPQSVYRLLIVQTEVCHLVFHEETDGGYPLQIDHTD